LQEILPVFFPPSLLISLWLLATAVLRGAQPAERNRFLQAGRSSISLLISWLDCLDPTKALEYTDMFPSWQCLSWGGLSCGVVGWSLWVSVGPHGGMLVVIRQGGPCQWREIMPGDHNQ